MKNHYQNMKDLRASVIKNLNLYDEFHENMFDNLKEISKEHDGAKIAYFVGYTFSYRKRPIAISTIK